MDANAAPFSRELENASDFTAISSNGLVSICGFGSLLSEKSARSTFPRLLNFRPGVVKNFRRIFAHIAPIFLERGIANVETKEMSSLSVEPCIGESIVVTVFEISLLEVPAFIQREHEFRFLEVAVVNSSEENAIHLCKAVICAKYSDEEYLSIRCQGNKDVFYERYGKHGIQQIWRDDILPCRLYLRHCVLAAKNLGQDAFESFLDHTYLGDRRTRIREYLDAHPDIMKEQPPEHLRDRYGG
ncbi:uncharacterized protein LOC9644560 [Selaginella moellendorffii]|uniref:uncharacterized protein LOC9644560 n=1 Tax=Selaginella moellendorffii TaxID=88036 RepID=UPI000D1CC766|nr:uncharacterized protein LOC9644560 [Selaginella moellendorffii]XP_024544956.1 uncharacterized protein LOC9644560 [Selaginella moellendorffii]XP_024544957.1 uncharacterized protein LOC9644560 [Selaginella moellendorffii]|eukprot:XP_024544955.1 uncharacterized protein LOC9644560 [Selaginella moellendorffii]